MTTVYNQGTGNGFGRTDAPDSNDHTGNGFGSTDRE
jgi:hypothetical protein